VTVNDKPKQLDYFGPDKQTPRHLRDRQASNRKREHAQALRSLAIAIVIAGLIVLAPCLFLLFVSI